MNTHKADAPWDDVQSLATSHQTTGEPPEVYTTVRLNLSSGQKPMFVFIGTYTIRGESFVYVGTALFASGWEFKTYPARLVVEIGAGSKKVISVSLETGIFEELS